jgi:hypothetical protein
MQGFGCFLSSVSLSLSLENRWVVAVGGWNLMTKGFTVTCWNLLGLRSDLSTSYVAIFVGFKLFEERKV